jgi:hypothetical protein
MDELLSSGIKLCCDKCHGSVFENGDETEVSKLKENLVICQSFEVCVEWAKYYKNISVLVSDIVAEIYYFFGDFVGENSEPFLCRLEDVVVFRTDLTMLMFHGDPLMRRDNEIIDRVVEAGIYNFWISLHIHSLKLRNQKIAIVQPLDEYYNFNLYHMQTAFYPILMGWCLSALCFMFEVMYIRLLSKRLLCY